MNNIGLVICVAGLISIWASPSSSEDCEGQIGKICYKDSSYPHQEIKSMWENNNNKLFDAFGHPRHDLSKSKVEASSFSSCNVCPSRESKKIQPISIVEDENEKLYIMSTDKYPRPEIEVHICENTACNIKGLQDNFGSSCQQQTTRINVLAYNTTSREFVGRTISYPSSCECILYLDTEQ